MDEAIQTAIVIVISVILLFIVYLLWTLSPKILGILLCIAGVLIFVYFPHMEKHQPITFIKSFKYIGIILFLIGILLILFV